MRKQLRNAVTLVTLMMSSYANAADPAGNSLLHDLMQLLSQPEFFMALVLAVVISLGAPLANTLYKEIRDANRIRNLHHK